MDVGDCSTDGTCEDVTGPGGAMIPIEGVKFSNATLLEETTLAIQQFSIVIGVALMCALLFFLMIAVDRFLDWLNEKWNTHFGGDKVDDDPEDPAALVGSFKRYK